MEDALCANDRKLSNSRRSSGTVVDLEFRPEPNDRLEFLPHGRHQAGRLGGETGRELSKSQWLSRPMAPCWDGTRGPERPPFAAAVRIFPAGVLLNVAKCPIDETLAKLIATDGD